MRELLNQNDTKTDEIDTLAIAETIRFGRYKPSRVPQDKLLALRELCRNRYYLIDMASDLKRKTPRCWTKCFRSLKPSLARSLANPLLPF